MLAVVLGAALPARATGFPDCVNGPLATNLVCNTSANFLDRAKALVDLFTLPELINNTVNGSPGVPRLGLPSYQWWSEALHGVAGSPGVSFAPAGQPFAFATSFPMPINLGAAFDDDLIHSIATVISTEARAFNNANRSGLDYFTPNINPFRDPRWGRGQETPGEDPLHISRYVRELVTGLQGGLGPSPFYKVVADCKHFAGYDIEDWEGNARYGFNAVITQQDLAEFYTPMFRSCVRDAKVGSAMCSYNAVNGVPSCASPFLLQNLLRDSWGFDGWVTSDCDAVGNVFTDHHYTTTLANASAVSMNAGTDVDCGSSYASSLPAAVSAGLVTQDTLKQALTRLYGSLVQLGYFDPAASQPFRQLGWQDVNTQASQQLALTAARESITLLKNDGFLPVKPTNKTVVLVGPWANATGQLQGNYQGTAPFLISPLSGLQTAGFTVQFFSGTTISGNDTSGFAAPLAAAKTANLVVFIGGIDDTVEREAMDRTAITWPGVQLDLITQLAAVGPPVVVVQMGGGQVDGSSLISNKNVRALIWGGYPGQSGGQALAEVLVGTTAPAGRLPVTQYPASYVSVPMTDMSVRPSAANPGRTYRWFSGDAVVPFGTGLHFTTFRLAWSDAGPRSFSTAALLRTTGSGPLDTRVLHSFKVAVSNSGKVASDYVALLFAKSTAGPAPAPVKTLVGYARVKNILPGKTATAQLDVTLGAISRADADGNSVIYPGTYTLELDTTGEIAHTFKITGSQVQILAFPKVASQ